MSSDGGRAGGSGMGEASQAAENGRGHHEQGDDSVYKRGAASKWTRGRKGDGDRKRARTGEAPRVARERERDYTTYVRHHQALGQH